MYFNHWQLFVVARFLIYGHMTQILFPSLRSHVSCCSLDGVCTHHSPQLMFLCSLDRRNQANYLEEILLWAQKCRLHFRKSTAPATYSVNCLCFPQSGCPFSSEIISGSGLIVLLLSSQVTFIAQQALNRENWHLIHFYA